MDGTILAADQDACRAFERESLVGLRIESLLPLDAGRVTGGRDRLGPESAVMANTATGLVPVRCRCVDIRGPNGSEPLTAWLVHGVPEPSALPGMSPSRGGLERLLALSPAVFYSCGPGPAFHTTFVSSNVEAQVGYRPEQFYADPEFWRKRIHPGDHERVMAELNRGARADGASHEYRFICADGRHRWFHDRFSVVRDAAGQVTELVGSWFDVSDRRSAEDRLRAREAQLRDVQRVARIGVWDWNVISNDVYWSEEVYHLFGLSRGEFGGTYEAFLALVHPDDRDDLNGAVEVALAGGASCEADCRIVLPDGEVRHLHVRGEVIFDDRHQPRSMAGSIIDVTMHKRAEDQAKAQRAELAHITRLGTLGEMAAGLAHELNQPLASIVNFASAGIRRLQAEECPRDEVLMCLRGAEEQALRASKIIQRLRLLVRKSEPRYERMDVNQAIRDVAELLAPEARSQGIPLHWELADPIPPVRADAIQIQQVVVNLVHNGLDATRESGRHNSGLTVTTAVRSDHMVEVSVRDSGPGIPADLRDRIFEPFFTTKDGGMGTGLSISRSIVEAHRGRIWATSRPEGGAVFFFVLPIAEEGTDE
jgi:PAS domain S-box-containing protein